MILLSLNKLMSKFIILICALLIGNVYAKDITATSWLVADYKGKVIDGENTEEVRSIGSITKLVTVMIVLDAQQNLDEELGKFTRGQLIQLAIVHSDNRAAEVLCENYPSGYRGCISAMNNKVAGIGLQKTKFIDPTGLGVFNTSTADELLWLVMEASTYPEIVSASHMSEVIIKRKRKEQHYSNTNPIVKTRNVIVSKTGYIRASGGCLVMMLNDRIVVLLNSKNTRTRAPEAEKLLARY